MQIESKDESHDNEFKDLMEFKKSVEKQEKEEQIQNQITRTISRKGKDPKNNIRNFEEENRQFGVKNEVDLVLQRISGLKDYSKGDFEKA